jgi:hypothetical protein
MVLTEVKIKPSEEDLSQRQTLWVGGLGPRVTDELLYELFLNVRRYFAFSTISNLF